MSGFGEVFAETGSKVIAEVAEKAPINLLYVGERDKSIIVDKALHRLYIYEGLELIESYNITTGQAKGDKQRRGDLKTPEGVYFFSELLDGKKLPSRYGTLAVVLDYPNPVDLMRGKTGSGIWLHGTDDPERLNRPRDSKGCVVAVNEDVLEIVRSLHLEKTPIIISESIEFIEESEARGESRRKLTTGIKEFLKVNNLDTEELKIFAYDNDEVIVAVLSASHSAAHSKDRVIYIKNDEVEGKRTFSIIDKRELKPGKKNVAELFKVF